MADDEDVNMVIEEARESMDKALDRFRKELTKVRTGRASTSLQSIQRFAQSCLADS